jgi:hypothetical protein
MSHSRPSSSASEARSRRMDPDKDLAARNIDRTSLVGPGGRPLVCAGDPSHKAWITALYALSRPATRFFASLPNPLRT